MKTFLIIIFALLQMSTANADSDLKGFGVIREFGGSDSAALFGLLPAAGSIEITGCMAPQFLASAGCAVGELNETVMSHIFLKSSNPMTQSERANLLSQWNGSRVIYFEGYTGNLCTNEETEYDITVSGTSNGKPFKSTFQFIALPNASGDCTYHKFGTIIQY